MTVLVTGGTGLIGSRVVRRLAERGDAVRCLVRATSRTDRFDGLAVERVLGDMRDPDSLRRAVAGCTAVVHLASPSSWAEIAGEDVEPVIVEGTRALVGAARAEGVGRFVHVSSAMTLDGSRHPRVVDETVVFSLAGSGLRYAEAKHCAERIVAASGVPAVTVCPGETYAAGDDEWVTAGALRDALRAWPVLAVRGGTSVAHADDVADGIVAALDVGRSGERYLLGGENLTVAEILRTAVAAAGLRRPVVVLPTALVGLVVAVCTALRLPPPIAPDMVGYVTRYWFGSSAKAVAELGYAPRPARRTIAEVVEWIRDAGSRG